MKIFLILLLLIFALPVAAADKIYKKVNPDGSVEYSDQPFDGSEEIPKQQAPATRFEKSPDINYQPPTRGDQEETAFYEVAVTSPTNDESIRDNAGNLTLRGRVEPSLRGGHRLRWMLDDEPLDQAGPSVSLSNVDRGTHTVRLEVVDRNDAVLVASETVTFHLLRRSAIPPANPAPNFNPPKSPAAP